MTEKAAQPRQSTVTALSSLGLLVAAGFAVSQLDIADEFKGAIATAVVGLPAAVGLGVDRVRQPRPERAREAISRDFTRNPLLVSLLFGGLVFLGLNYLFGLVYAIIGQAEAYAPQPYLSAVAGQEILFGGLFLALPIVLLLVYRGAKASAYRIARLPSVWLVGSLVLYASLNTVVDVVGSPQEFVDEISAGIDGGNVFLATFAQWLVLVAVLSLAVLAGVWQAARTRDSYAAKRFLNLLPDEDREAYLELLRDEAAMKEEPAPASEPSEQPQTMAPSSTPVSQPLPQVPSTQGSLTTASVAANWYPDPRAPSRYRYWDGQGWTTFTAPR
jgi:hypothetical protein